MSDSSPPSPAAADGSIPSDANGCPILPPGTIINLAASHGWTSTPAYLTSAVYALLFVVLLIHLALTPWRLRGGRMSHVLAMAALYAVVRFAGLLCRGLAAVAPEGPSIGMFITVLVLQAAGFLPLIKILLNTLLDWLGAVKSSSSYQTAYRAYRRFLDFVILGIVAVAITGAVWVGQAAPCQPSPTAVLIRNVSLWAIVGIAGLALLLSLRVAYFPIGFWLFIQALLMGLKAAYNVMVVLYPPWFAAEFYFYLLALLPEFLFVAPFAMGKVYLADYIPAEEGEL
ncbi:hypothetical protein HK101_003422 [Irineochytrium annulatum]|nr:hypothetical protein HK101_003422 [Irineochytrium annulatum]